MPKYWRQVKTDMIKDIFECKISNSTSLELVSLEEMLAARELRAARQMNLLQSYQLPLICFTLNIAGPTKTYPLARQAFDEGKRLMLSQLARHHMKVAFFEEWIEKTGYECYMIVDALPEKIKRQTVAIEDQSAIGRLFDIDVLLLGRGKISRQDLGLAERKCLLCDNPAAACARSRSHSLEDLDRQTRMLIRNYFDQQYADCMARLATRALLYEVNTTPKPGLVDRDNNGAHDDMDTFTFIDSATALTSWFRDIARQGLAFAGEPKDLLASIRYTGQLAEDAMFAATNGINTHKGLVFSLGIICAAAGYLHARGLPEDTDNLLDCCALIASGAEDDLSGVTRTNAKTHGENIFAASGIKGIRGEAAAGFPSVRQTALPIINMLTTQGYTVNDAGAVALLHLLTRVQDTNIISRAGLKTLQLIQEQAKNLISQKDLTVECLMTQLKRLDASFIQNNISAGGCADLLAVAYLLYFKQK